MHPVPYQRRFLFANGPDSLYPSELPDHLFLGQARESNRHVVLEDGDRAAHVYICGVTGSGKSRFLENMLVQDIICQRPLCLLDPTGSLYRKALEFIARCLEIAERRNHELDSLLERYLFLDLDTPANPLRLNPLEPQGEETTEEQVDDFLKAAERLFGDIDQTRRIRNNLRNCLWVIAELNRLPQEERPAIEGFQYPLNLTFAAEFLAADDDTRVRLVRAIPDSRLNSYVKTYWTKFFARFTAGQQQERLESTWNVLQYFLGDSLVARFFDTRESTIHVPELLRQRRSLFCSLPLGKNLKGCQLVGTFLATKFQRAAYRRKPEERSPYYLYIDEFHEFADIEFAKAATTLRQYNLRMINVHQSQSQPPFHTTEGRSILETIKANAQVKILFRLSREDAEGMTKELFELSQRRHNFSYSEVARSQGSSQTKTRTVSFQKSRSTGLSWSRADSIAIAESENYGIAKTEGVTLGQSLTEGFGESIQETISETITRSQSETLTEMRSRAHGISVVIGDNWSHMVNHNTGFTYTQSQNESLAVQRGSSEQRSDSLQRGETATAGRDFKVTDSHGNNFVRTNGSTAFHRRSGPDSGSHDRSDSQSTALGETHQQATAQGRSFSQAIQNLRGVAASVGSSLSSTGTRGNSLSKAQNTGSTTGKTLGGSRQRGITQTDTVSQSRAKMQGVSQARGKSLAIGKSHQISLAESFQQLEQLAHSYGETLSQTVSRTSTAGQSVEEGSTVGTAEAAGESATAGETTTEHRVYFTLEGEREISINDLQKLPTRHCVVAKTALAAIEVETYFIPDGYYSYWDRNLPAEVLQRQLRRLRPEQGVTEEVRFEPPAAVGELPENSPWEF